MSSALGSNLSELDRLLLELNAVQQNSPSFPTTGRQTANHILQKYSLGFAVYITKVVLTSAINCAIGGFVLAVCVYGMLL